MRIQNRIKRTTKQYIIVAFICLFVIGGAAVLTTAMLTGQIRDEYQSMLKEAYDKLEKNQRNIFVTKEDIAAGDMITEDKIEKRTVYSSQPQNTFMTGDKIGSSALIDISSGTELLASMITNDTIAAGLREMQYDVIQINSNIVIKDTVDIRIFYPNGESYVVLAKKAIKGLIPETASIFLWMNEEELLRMSAAIVDAGLYQGAELYVTKYIEPNIQEASKITYIPSLSILSLIENDPNIIERCSQELNKNIRKALENRLADSINTDVTSIDWSIDSNSSNFAASSTLSDGAPSDTSIQDNIQNSTLPDNSSESNNDNQGETDTQDPGSPDELGNADFIYYAEEEAAKDGDIEYGE